MTVFGELAPGDVFRLTPHGHDYRKVDDDRAIRWADRGGIAAVHYSRIILPRPETDTPQ